MNPVRKKLSEIRDRRDSKKLDEYYKKVSKIRQHNKAVEAVEVIEGKLKRRKKYPKAPKLGKIGDKPVTIDLDKIAKAKKPGGRDLDIRFMRLKSINIRELMPKTKLFLRLVPDGIPLPSLKVLVNIGRHYKSGEDYNEKREAEEVWYVREFYHSLLVNYDIPENTYIYMKALLSLKVAVKGKKPLDKFLKRSNREWLKNVERVRF